MQQNFKYIVFTFFIIFLSSCANSISNQFNGKPSVFAGEKNNYLYVVNEGNNTISICKVGDINKCFNTHNWDSDGEYTAKAIAVAPNRRFAYISSISIGGEEEDTIYVCSIDDTTGDLYDCKKPDPRMTKTLSSPLGMAFDNAGHFYVANTKNNSIVLCAVNNDDGMYDSCAVVGKSSEFAEPFAIALSKTTKNAYITNKEEPAITICPILSNFTFGDCYYASKENTFSQTEGVAIDPNGKYLYITSSEPELATPAISCAISLDGKTLSSCDGTGFGDEFMEANGLALDTTGKYSYLSFKDNNTIFHCVMDSGDYTDCDLYEPGILDEPVWIAYR